MNRLLFLLIFLSITNAKTVLARKIQNAAARLDLTKTETIAPCCRHAFLGLRGGEDLNNDPHGNTPAAISTSTYESLPNNAAVVAESDVATKSDDTKVKSFSSALNNPKMINAIERTGPAILMLLLLGTILKYTGEKGLISMVSVLQIGMYVESTNVIQSGENLVKAFSFGTLERWWWFSTVFAGTTLRNILEMGPKYDLGVFAMIALGLVVGVVRMESDPNAGAESFKSYLNRYGGSNFALIFLLGQSSFWIKTIKTYGLMWALYPALLVIVNDTMAYVFGVLIGKHKILPLLSPKKTVEGFIGAGLSTCLVSLPLLNLCTNLNLGDGDKVSASLCGEDNKCLARHAMIMAAYTSLISPFGGFLASATKRAHGKKDFGTFIPGHGGVIDRLDCQIITAPFVFLYLKTFLQGVN